MSTETASFQRFRSRVEYLQQHMQAVDAAIGLVLKQTKTTSGQNITISAALGLRPGKYDQLDHPVNHTPRVYTYSKSRNYEQALLSLYGNFTEYLRSALDEMFKHNPMLVVGKASSNSMISFVDIVKLGNYDAIAEHMTKTIFRKLEDERSTIKLLDKILDHTKITLPAASKEKAIMFLEMRHLFVHNEGKCDKAFHTKYSSKMSLSVGQKLPTEYQTTKDAIDTVYKIVESMDSQLIRLNLASPR